ncbi:MAG: TRAP transporter substrate-binding protein DctP [Succinivibrionaceae bacterium]|nr:TRAP transporter substrate-binding protein DctP [Succinivibrionaceae bacterium]
MMIRACLAMLLAIALPATALELRLGHSMQVGSAQHLALEAMAQQVERESQGSMTIRIFPEGKLGTEREMVGLAMDGSLDLVKINGSLAASLAPAYGVMSLPYLFRSRAHVQAFIDSDLPGKYLLNATAGHGIIGLSLIGLGTRNLYLRKPASSPADLKGLTLRTTESAVMMRFVSLLGANPTPLPFSDVASALDNGTIDGAENAICPYLEMGHYRSAPYYLIDSHTRTPDVIFVSEQVWQDLTKDQRDLLISGAKVARAAELRLTLEHSKKCLARAAELGVTIRQVDEEAFRSAARPLLEKARLDPETRDLVAAIEAL